MILLRTGLPRRVVSGVILPLALARGEPGPVQVLREAVQHQHLRHCGIISRVRELCSIVRLGERRYPRMQAATARLAQQEANHLLDTRAQEADESSHTSRAARSIHMQHPRAASTRSIHMQHQHVASVFEKGF